ncbi:MAG TPA: hypothetical protein VKX46_21670, partial [Ktedonobacteraceae bacterium]|nr:hypothetical protein [Ktedonobacteraceae bacterium]
PLFLQKGLTETAMLRIMQLFAHLQRNLVPIQSTQGPISVYATQDTSSTTVSLILINKTSTTQQVRVSPGSVLPLNPWKSASVTLQGYSMAVLTLHRNGSNEAFTFNNTGNPQQAAPAVQHVVCQDQTGSAFVC